MVNITIILLLLLLQFRRCIVTICGIVVADENQRKKTKKQPEENYLDKLHNMTTVVISNIRLASAKNDNHPATVTKTIKR